MTTKINQKFSKQRDKSANKACMHDDGEHNDGDYDDGEDNDVCGDGDDDDDMQ